jgi:hypothetical protein
LPTKIRGVFHLARSGKLFPCLSSHCYCFADRNSTTSIYGVFVWRFSNSKVPSTCWQLIIFVHGWDSSPSNEVPIPFEYLGYSSIQPTSIVFRLLGFIYNVNKIVVLAYTSTPQRPPRPMTPCRRYNCTDGFSLSA